FPSHPYARDRTARRPNRNVDVAGPPHLHTLQAEHRGRLLWRHHVVADQITPERTARAAGRRLFEHAQTGSEHAAVRGRAVVPGLRGKEEDAVRPGWCLA